MDYDWRNYINQTKPYKKKKKKKTKSNIANLLENKSEIDHEYCNDIP